MSTFDYFISCLYICQLDYIYNLRYNYGGDDMKKVEMIVSNSKNNLFSSIIFLLFGIVLFTNPGGILKFLSYIAGGVLILIGIINILGYIKTLKNLNIEENIKLISGIILIVLGLIVMFFSSFIETTIRLIVGIWLIYCGILKIIDSTAFKSDKVSYYVDLIIGILIIALGFYVSLKTNLVLSVIGLFIIIYSILDIISYIVFKKAA